ncbi:MAG: hypothetical protein ACXWL2_04520 [Candidatus Chromulinivorax sp.]
MNKNYIYFFTTLIFTNIYSDSNLPDLSKKITLLDRMINKIIETRTELRITKAELESLETVTDPKKIQIQKLNAEKSILLHKQHLLIQKLAVYKKEHRELKNRLETITENNPASIQASVNTLYINDTFNNKLQNNTVTPELKKSTCSSLKDFLTCKMM